MNTQEIIKAISKKFPQSKVVLIICEDGSGRVTDNWQKPYESVPLLGFGNIDHLIAQLQEDDAQEDEGDITVLGGYPWGVDQ